MGTMLKDRISSPLEAGPSVHGNDDLPRHLISALDYASKKLARKAMHFTLIVIMREYQLPLQPFPTGPCHSEPHTPTLPLSSNPPSQSIYTPSSQSDHFSSPAEGRVLERIVVAGGPETIREAAASPTFSESSSVSTSTVSTADSTFSASHGLVWSRGPYSPMASTPMTPATPFTTASSSISASTTDTSSVVSSALPQDPYQFGIRLVSTNPLSMKEEKVLERIFQKTARKFRLGDEWFSVPGCASSFGLPPDLMRRSTTQYEVVFSSEGITLLALEHLYSFKAVLQSYARTQSPYRLEDGVDELRRLILANGRRKLLKSSLLDNYKWLGLKEQALADIGCMYRRAYGDSGLVNDVDPSWPLPDTPLQFIEVKSFVSNAEEAEAEAEEEAEVKAGDENDVEIELGYDDHGSFKMMLLEAAATFAARPLKDRRRAQMWVLDQDLILEKETNVVAMGRDSEEFDLEEIENWYRQMDLESEMNQPLANHGETPAVIPPKTEASPARLCGDLEAELEGARHTTRKSSAPPPTRGPMLKLQTTFSRAKRRPKSSDTATGDASHANATLSVPGHEEGSPDDEETEEELTARPKSAVNHHFPRPQRLDSLLSIDSIMSPNGGSGGRDSGSKQVGPATPHGYDDISPITRGEWGFLMFQKSGRTAAVETC